MEILLTFKNILLIFFGKSLFIIAWFFGYLNYFSSMGAGIKPSPWHIRWQPLAREEPAREKISDAKWKMMTDFFHPSVSPLSRSGDGGGCDPASPCRADPPAHIDGGASAQGPWRWLSGLRGLQWFAAPPVLAHLCCPGARTERGPARKARSGEPLGAGVPRASWGLSPVLLRLTHPCLGHQGACSCKHHQGWTALSARKQKAFFLFSRCDARTPLKTV